MRILCIDASDCRLGAYPNFLKEGEVYIADGEEKSADGVDCYVISSLPNTVTNSGKANFGPLYKKSRFIPISDVEDEVLVEDKKLENV